MSKRRVSRREFVGDVAAAGMACMIIPRHVLGGPRFTAPSDRLNVACIGVGGKGQSDVRGVADAGANIYAQCDVDLNAAEASFNGFPKSKKYRDFREMLDQEARNIDAVTVSTPDHVHAAAAMLAMKAGKHVFCQKPLARTLHEVRTIMQAATRSKVATQMGNQGHAGDGTRLLREWYEAGVIGQVKEIHYWTNRPIWPQGIERPLEAFNPPPYLDWNLWLGPAADRPYAPAYAPFRWRGWWDFGAGALGDIAPHAMDAAFWTLDLGFPIHIEAESTKVYPETAPKISRITYDFPAKGDRPALSVIWRDGELAPPRPVGLPPEIEWPYHDVGNQVWYGTDGVFMSDAYGDGLRHLDAKRHEELTATPPAQKYARSPGVYAEWIRACKGGEPAGSNFAGHAGPLTQMVLLGNLAVRMQQPLDINPTTGAVTNVPVPEEWIKPRFRTGWSL
jgi:predicted dehydrogenase